MSTDLMTQLSDYGAYHRETQEPVAPGDATHRFVSPVGAGPGPSYTLRRAGAVLVTAAVVALFIAIPALLRSPTEEEPADPMATIPADVTSTLAATTVPAAESTGPGVEFEGFVMVQELTDGSLVGLKDGTAWRSSDGGDTWASWHQQDQEIDLLTMAPDGAVIAVRNPNSTNESMGEGSTVNNTPEVHRFDPETESWTVIPLPRPGLPVPDLAPASTDPEVSACPLGGLQSWVDGNAIVASDQIVILGDHRVVGDGICDEDFQFFWTSNNGLDWTLVPSMDLDGYLVDLMWTGERYVGIGSELPWWYGGGGPTPRVWTSTDLQTWGEQDLDLSVLPVGAMIQMDAVGQSSFGGTPPVDIRDGDHIRLGLTVLRYRPGLDAGITDVEALREWRLDAGLTESPFGDDISLEESLARDGIDFPLDEDELRLLNGFYSVVEPYGTLTLTSSDGTDWEAVYTP